MTQPAARFSIPTISSIFTFVIVMMSLTIILLPTPAYFLDMIITLNLTFPLVILCISLYTHRLSNVASLPPLLGLSVFYRLAISIALYRCFGVYRLWQENAWKNPNDFMRYFSPSYVTEFINFISSGNLLYLGLLCLSLSTIAAIAHFSIFLASKWAKPDTTLEIQTIQSRQDALMITPEESCTEKESVIQANHTYSTLRGTSLLLGLEAVLGLFFAIFAASITITHADNPTQLALRFLDFPLTTQFLVINSKLLTFSVILGSEALIRGLPLLLTSLSLWLLLTRRDLKEQSLGEQITETLKLHPYSLLYSGLGLSSIIYINFLTQTPSRWYIFLPISLNLIFIAFSVFLASDVQEQLTQNEKALTKRKTLLGLTQDNQAVSAITLQVSDALSRHFNLHYIESVKLEDISNYPPRLKIEGWQGLNDYLSYFKRRTKFMRTMNLHLITGEGTGSRFLHHLQNLYQDLEKKLGVPVQPVQILINGMLADGQYRLFASGELQMQGEISLSSDEALTDKSMQDLLQQLKATLLSTRQQQ